MRTGSARANNVAWKVVTVTDYDDEIQTCAVKFEEDGKVEAGVPQGMLRKVGGGKAGGSSKSRSASKAKGRVLNQINQIVADFDEEELGAALDMLRALQRVASRGKS